MMNKIKVAFRSVFAPSTVTYDERRRGRTVFWLLLTGVGVGVGFGFSLYYLCSNHRF